MRWAILAAITTGAAAFTPTLFFNVTMNPLHAMLDYRPSPSKTPITTYSSRGQWTTTYTETDMATFQPGDVGQGQPLRRGVASEDGGPSMEIPLPFRSVYVHGIAPEGMVPLGDPAYPKAPKISLDMEPGEGSLLQYLYKRVNNSGDFTVSWEFDAMSNRTATLSLSDPAAKTPNGTDPLHEVVVKQVDVTLGIEAAATSLESVPTRTELFNLNGGENPLFLYTQFAMEESNLTDERGNFTFPPTEDPAQPAPLVAFGSVQLSCTLPRNTSMVTVSAYTGPEAAERSAMTITLYPSPPLAYDYGKGTYEQADLTLWNNFTALVSAYTRVLDPNVEYIIEIKHFGRDARYSDVYDRTSLQSITFYSSTDKAPEGGGPAEPPDVIGAAATASKPPAVISPTYTGEVIGSTMNPVPTGAATSGSAAQGRPSIWAASVGALVFAALLS